MIGESVDWLYDVAMKMDAEDGVIWVYGLGDEQLMAFTNFSIETLVDLIKIHKDDPTLLRIEKAKPFIPAAYAGWLRTISAPMRRCPPLLRGAIVRNCAAENNK
ncbi:MAG: hypothetical protein WA156_05475 [Methylocystis silviterrae]